ncbi:MAG: hypothetical protein V1660_01710 [archaeon]
MIVKSIAPSRVDFAGGTLDIPLFAEKEGGCTLNCAVKKYSYVDIHPIKQHATIINSINYKSKIQIIDGKIIYDGETDLLKAAIKRTSFFEDVEIKIRHELPPHSRLGTSSSVGVALISAIYKYQGKKIEKNKVADLATDLEIEELGLRNGPQDQYAAAIGGINFLKFDGKSVKVEKPKVSKDTIKELERRMILCYCGQANVSGDMNKRVTDGYINGNKRINDALHEIKEITIEMKEHLIKGNTQEFAFLLNEERLNREKLDKDISKGLAKFIYLGMKNADAAKILGAGCGGTLLFYSKEKKLNELKKSLIKSGGIVFPFRFDFEGVRAWKIK